jgi:hypothetical protein
MTKDVKVSDEVFEAVKNEMRDERQVVELSRLPLCCFLPRTSRLLFRSSWELPFAFVSTTDGMASSFDYLRL